MKYMIDTDICVLIMNGVEQAKKMFEFKRKEGVCISSITFSELEYGVCKSKKYEQNKNNLFKFLTLVDIFNYDDNAALEYGWVRAKLEERGNVIGPLDTLIAAHALSLGLTVVTNNTREFSRVEGLACEDWL